MDNEKTVPTAPAVHEGAPVRAVYVRPALRRLGAVRDLTLGGSGSVNDGGVPGKGGLG